MRFFLYYVLRSRELQYCYRKKIISCRMAEEEQQQQQDLVDLLEVAIRMDPQVCASGHMSVSIYDTAWVSCIVKDGEACFPSSFQFILEHQQTDGLWPSTGPSCSDLLNSLGGLHALVERQRRHTSFEMQSRIDKAKAALDTALNTWQIEESGGVGFEMLIPVMLDLLDRQHISFNFPAHSALRALCHRKMATIPFEKLYKHPHSVLHSLEAFFLNETFDFDRMRTHKVLNSMLGSPAATAAYLMKCSAWDSDAEDYLRQVIAEGAGRSCGGVPSAFPSNIFETTWVSSAMLRLMVHLLTKLVVAQLLTTVIDDRSVLLELSEGARARIYDFIESTDASQGRCVGFGRLSTVYCF